MSVPPIPPDPAEEAATLIEKVGRSAQEARRYRRLATSLAEPTFDRALGLGSIVRNVLRTAGGEAPAFTAAVAELRTLLRNCEDAIAAVRREAAYREAAASFAAGAVERVAALAPTLFTSVVAGAGAPILYWPVPIVGRRTAQHFLAPEECAERIHVIAVQGLTAQVPPPDLGGDDTIGAVVLSVENEVAESPIALVFEAGAFPAPLCRLEDGGSALYYAPCLHAPFAVRAAALVEDEWWAIRPDAYHGYLRDLAQALQARDLRLDVEP